MRASFMAVAAALVAQCFAGAAPGQVRPVQLKSLYATAPMRGPMGTSVVASFPRRPLEVAIRAEGEDAEVVEAETGPKILGAKVKKGGDGWKIEMIQKLQEMEEKNPPTTLEPLEIKKDRQWTQKVKGPIWSRRHRHWAPRAADWAHVRQKVEHEKKVKEATEKEEALAVSLASYPEYADANRALRLLGAAAGGAVVGVVGTLMWAAGQRTPDVSEPFLA